MEAIAGGSSEQSFLQAPPLQKPRSGCLIELQFSRDCLSVAEQDQLWRRPAPVFPPHPGSLGSLICPTARVLTGSAGLRRPSTLKTLDEGNFTTREALGNVASKVNKVSTV